MTELTISFLKIQNANFIALPKRHLNVIPTYLMATTFILPFAIGACTAINAGDPNLNAKILTDAFGIVAMIAMTPLITIQVLGLIGKVRQDNKMKKIHREIEQIADGMVYYTDIERKPPEIDFSNTMTYTMEETLHGN